MAWISATSVRIQEPGARIVIVADGLTDEANRELGARFAGLADEIIIRHVELPSPVARNRVHRIALRDFIIGDFLYLDSDTLAIAPLAGVTNTAGDVGAATDFNIDLVHRWFPADMERPFRALGWDYPLPYYLNTGVVLLRDTAASRSFCREWMRRYEASSSMRHVWDQATFNSALFASGVPHVVLDHGFNAMVVKRHYRFRRSAILHFFGSEEEQRGTIFEHLLGELERTGAFDRPAYERSLRQGHPWGPRPEPWQLRHSRNYVRAAAAVAARAFRRAWRGQPAREDHA